MKADWYCLSIRWTLYILWWQFENYFDKLVKPNSNQCGFHFWQHLLGNTNFCGNSVIFLHLNHRFNWQLPVNPRFHHTIFPIGIEIFKIQLHVFRWWIPHYELHSKMVRFANDFLKPNISGVCIFIQIFGQSVRNHTISSCWLSHWNEISKWSLSFLGNNFNKVTRFVHNFGVDSEIKEKKKKKEKRFTMW